MYMNTVATISMYKKVTSWLGLRSGAFTCVWWQMVCS